MKRLALPALGLAFLACGDMSAAGDPIEEVKQAVTTNCVPQPYEVAIFEHSDRGSNCIILGRSGDGTGYTLPRDGFRDNEVSAYIVGADVKVTFFDAGDFNPSNLLTAAPGTESWVLGTWNNRISSLRIESASVNCLNPGSAQVALFDGANYTGDCTIFDWKHFDCDAQRWGYMRVTDAGFAKNTASSMLLGPEASVQLCRDEFLGACETVTQSIPDLDAIGMRNQASSLRVSSTTPRRRVQPVCVR